MNTKKIITAILLWLVYIVVLGFINKYAIAYIFHYNITFFKGIILAVILSLDVSKNK